MLHSPGADWRRQAWAISMASLSGRTWFPHSCKPAEKCHARFRPALALAAAATALAAPSRFRHPPGPQRGLSLFRERVPCLTPRTAPSQPKKFPLSSSSDAFAAVFLEKDCEVATKAASDAGLSSLDVQTEDHRRAAAALPEAAINAQGRFSPSPAPPAIIAELERLLKAATGQGATLASGAKSETASATISADLWRQLKPGSLVLAAGFDQNNNLIEW